jgi:hypothetical protein
MVTLAPFLGPRKPLIGPSTGSTGSQTGQKKDRASDRPVLLGATGTQNKCVKLLMGSSKTTYGGGIIPYPERIVKRDLKFFL